MIRLFGAIQILARLQQFDLFTLPNYNYEEKFFSPTPLQTPKLSYHARDSSALYEPRMSYGFYYARIHSYFLLIFILIEGSRTSAGRGRVGFFACLFYFFFFFFIYFLLNLICDQFQLN